MWDEKPEIMYNYEINLTEKEQTTATAVLFR